MSKLAKRVSNAIAKYDPEKGVKTIRVLEAAEKHWAKAKNVDQLKKVIRAKLEAQSEFVLWWDSQGPGANHGGPGRKQGRKRVA